MISEAYRSHSSLTACGLMAMDTWFSSKSKWSQWVAVLATGLQSLAMVVLFQNLGFPATGSDPALAQCPAQVVSNEVVVSNYQRREVGYHVLPQDIIEHPGEWPYFAWSDSPLGVVRTRDGSGYLFFGSDGSCHKGCSGETPRSGSITVSTGTLDHPLGQPLNDPNPPPREFLLPTSANLPATMDYVGGGPVTEYPTESLAQGTCSSFIMRNDHYRAVISGLG